MKNLILMRNLFFLSLIMLIAACSSDDPIPPSISANDFSTAVDENQATGTALGSIGATGTDGAITYSITSQTPNGALAIDATTGGLSVANGDVFDFETNPTITANISVTGTTVTETVTATVTLNDIDDIEFFLSTSKSDYTAAADGDWVIITENEYNTLASSLNNVTKVASSDTNYDTTATSQAGGSFTISNDNGQTMPTGSYVFAAKYRLETASSVNYKLKQSSTSNSAGFSNLGNTLTGSDLGNNYLVLKGSSSATTNTGFLSIFDDTGALSFRGITGSNLTFGSGDVNVLPSNQGSSFVYYQGLSTTQKQW